jgi:hypothetical protein
MTDPKAPRLADLDPAALGADAVGRVLRRLERLAIPLSPGVALRWDGGPDPDARRPLPPSPAASGLAMTVADLCRYAQRGVGAGSGLDWPDETCAGDALMEVGEALWSRPVDEGESDSGWTVDELRAALRADGEPADPVRLAVGCALARWLVYGGRPVTTGELAALAGVTRGLVQQLAAAGEVATAVEVEGRARVAYVAADEARRWLAARGAPGWR